MNHNRRKVLTQQENEIPTFDSNINYFAQVVGCRAGDIFEVEYLNPSEGSDLIPALVRLPPKFKHVIWAKVGDLVILAPEDTEFNSRTAFYIQSILASHHIKWFMQQHQLPECFVPEKFAHKSYARHDNIQATTATDRFLGATGGDDSDDEFDLPEINNRHKRPFADSSSEEDEASD